MELTTPRRHGPVSIRLVRPRDAKVLQQELMANRSWLQPWEATSPDGPVSFDMRLGIRRLLQQYRDGAGVPFVMEYDGEVTGQLNVWGIARGSLASATIGYWVSERFAGRSITPPQHMEQADPALHPKAPGEATSRRCETAVVSCRRAHGCEPVDAPCF